MMENKIDEPEEQKTYLEIATEIFSHFLPEQVEEDGVAILGSD
mgnify:FL=1